MSPIKKLKSRLYPLVLGTCFLVVFSCSACVAAQQKYGFEQYKYYNAESEQIEKELIDYIATRTVRVIIRCKTINNKTKKVIREYKNSVWGTGTILFSTNNYSFIQTAEHIVVNKNRVSGDLTRVCDNFAIERKDSNNVLIDSYRGKVVVLAKDKKFDLAILKVYKNYGVSSIIAKETYLGQSIRVIGYPDLRTIEGYPISYEKGYIATHNMGQKNNYRSYQRIGTAGYFGNSGGAVWNQQGEIVGTVTSMIAFRTSGGVIPQQNCLYGPNVKALRKFYEKHKQLHIILKNK